ncbi:MAG: hypothetical protein MJA83_10750 [Gammaproteobacteria bacterium]|nr:hypothetical protein [Gammaproteobacteria bacterium]
MTELEVVSQMLIRRPISEVFEALESGTLVKISVVGFHGSADEVLAQSVDSKGGFTLVLAGARAFLEYGVSLNLVEDQRPEAGA